MPGSSLESPPGFLNSRSTDAMGVNTSSPISSVSNGSQTASPGKSRLPAKCKTEREDEKKLDSPSFHPTCQVGHSQIKNITLYSTWMGKSMGMEAIILFYTLISLN